MRLADWKPVSKEIQLVEALHKCLLESWLHLEVVLREILRNAPPRVRDIAKAEEALGLPKRHWHLVRPNPGTVLRGSAESDVAYRQGRRRG